MLDTTLTDTTVSCEGCGYESDDLTTVQTLELCSECIAVCEDCEDTVPSEDCAWLEGYGKLVCEACTDANYISCEDCSELVHEWDRYAVSTIRGYEYVVCESCYCDGYSSCEPCGYSYPSDDMRYTDWEAFCPDCYDQHSGEGDVDDWNYRPLFNFHGVGTLYLGMELEVEGGHSAIANIYDMYNRDTVYFKHDGSLDHGFELVTHPMTLGWHNENTFIEDTTKALRQAGASSYNANSCGIHIHMNRGAFTNSHMWKFLQFHYRNADAIQTIAQRRDSSWAKFVGKHDADYRKRVSKDSYSYSDRYVAVNLNNSETIELRYFKGNLNAPSVRKNLEFAVAVYEYTKQLTYQSIRQYNGLGWGAFMVWMRDQRNVYPNLAAFISKRIDRLRNPVTYTRMNGIPITFGPFVTELFE